MSATTATERPSDTPEPVGGRGAKRGRPVITALVLYALAIAVYIPLSLHSPLPVMWRDEFRYAHLARSLADGLGFTWRGEHIPQPAALYVYLLAPAWRVFSDTASAYTASKVVSTASACAVVIPVYLLGRVLVGHRWAVVTTILTAAGTWMVFTASLATLNLALPLSTAALACTVMAIRRPGGAYGWLALALAVLATWARIQLAVLIPAVVIALALDVVRAGRGSHRARAAAHGRYLAAGVAGCLLMAAVAVVHPQVTGEYAGFVESGFSVSGALSKIGVQALSVITVSAFAPVALAVAVTLRRTAWRDEVVGPLLCVFWGAVVFLVVQSGLFIAYADTWWAIERYVAYAAPVALLIGVAVVRDARLLDGRTVGLAGLVSASVVLLPGRLAVSEQRGAWGVADRLHALLGWSTQPALMGAALATVLVLAAALWMRRRGHAGAPVVAFVAAVGAVFAVQSESAWSGLYRVTTTFRQSLPAQLNWIDEHAHGGTAVIALTQHAPEFNTLDFFNRDVTRVYAPATGVAGQPPVGPVCDWSIGDGGVLDFGGRCGPVPHTFLINDPAARMTFYDEASHVVDQRVGELIRVADVAKPRLKTLVVLPCPRRGPSFSASLAVTPATAPIRCAPGLTGAAWLDKPAELAVTYRGGRVARTVRLDTRSWTIQPARHTTIRFRIPAGGARFSLRRDWSWSAGNPKIVGVDLLEGKQREPIGDPLPARALVG